MFIVVCMFVKLYDCTIRVFDNLYWPVVTGCVSYRCGTFGILTQEEHSYLYGVQSGSCEVCSLLYVCVFVLSEFLVVCTC